LSCEYAVINDLIMRHEDIERYLLPPRYISALQANQHDS